MGRRNEHLAALSTRQRLFVHAFVSCGGNIRRAMMLAGYKGREVMNLRAVPHVRAALRNEIREAVRERGVSVEDVVAELSTIAFSPVGDPEVSTSDKTRALVWIGKHLAMFTEKIDLTKRTRWDTEVDLTQLPDDELLQLEQMLQRVRVTRLGPEMALPEQSGS